MRIDHHNMADGDTCSAASDISKVSSSTHIAFRFPELPPSRHVTDLSRWPIFSVLETELLATVKKLCVFGSSGNEAIFITDTDDVYAFGTNCSSCLGLGNVVIEGIFHICQLIKALVCIIKKTLSSSIVG